MHPRIQNRVCLEKWSSWSRNCPMRKGPVHQSLHFAKPGCAIYRFSRDPQLCDDAFVFCQELENAVLHGKSVDTIHGLVPKGVRLLYSSQGKSLAVRENA